MSNHPTPTPALTEEEIEELAHTAELYERINAEDGGSRSIRLAAGQTLRLLSAARDRAELVEFLKTHGKATYECLLSRALGLSDATAASSAHNGAAELAKLLEKYRT